LERLSKGDLDADAQANLRADIENLQQQLATHQKTLDEMDTNPGRGFVAADAPRVAKPTPEQYVQIGAYTKALQELRTAVNTNDAEAMKAAKTRLDEIENAALSDDTLLEHIDTLSAVRDSLENNNPDSLYFPIEEEPGSEKFVEGMGRQFDCESARYGSFQGKTYTDIQNMIGRPPDQISGGTPPEGAVRLTWRLADDSFIHIDVPGSDNSSPYEINRLPHVARTAPIPHHELHLSDTGISVPANSTPAHIEFQPDATLTRIISRGRR
jgi:hypothetical protein